MARRTVASGAVKIDILAGSAQFNKSVKQAQNRLRRMRRNVAKITREMRTQFRNAAVAVAGFASSILAGTKQMTDYSSQLVEAARATNLTTKELENLRALFRGDGIGIVQTDKAMKDFTVRIGEAQRGVSTYKKAFEDLGISLRNERGEFKDQRTLLTEVAAKLRNAGSQAEASAIAYNLFGRSGKDLLPILLKYGERLDDAAKHAGRFRTLTDEQHDANKRLGQIFSDTQENVVDFIHRGLALIAPQVETIAERFNNWIADLKNEDGLEGFIAKVKDLVDNIARLYVIFSAIKMGGTIGAVFGPIGALVGGGIGGLLGLGGYELFKTFGEHALKSQKQLLEERRDEILNTMDYEYNPKLVEEYNNIMKKLREIEEQARKAKNALDGVGSGTGSGSGGGSGGGGGSAGDVVASVGAHQFTRKGQMVARANHQIEEWAKEEAKALSQYLIEQTFGHATQSLSRTTSLSRGDPNERGSASRRRYLRALRRDTDDDMRMRYGYYPSMFDQFKGSRYPTNLNQTGYFIDAFKNGAGIGPNRHTFGLPYNRNQGLSGDFTAPNWMNLVSGGGTSSGAIGGDFPFRGSLGEGMLVLDMKDGVAIRIPRPEKYNANQGMRRNTKGIRNWMNLVSGGGASAGASGGFGIYGDPQMAFGDAPAGDAMRARWLREQRDRDTGVRRVKEAVEEYNEAIKKSDVLTDKFTSVFDSWGDSVLNNFTNLRDAVEDLLGDIGRMLIKQFITQPMAQQAGDWLGSLFGSLGIAAKANGGMASGLTLVGERGPELVDFSSPAMVTSNERIRSAMAGGRGGSPTIVYNINSTDGPGVRAALAQATPGIVNAALSKTMEETTRYGDAQRMIRGT